MGGPEPSDEELLARHVAGDPDAFGVLFARHRDRLWAVAVRTVSNPEDAADALQEAMISAFRRAESFRGGSAVTTWLHRVVVNACLDHVRRARVRAADPLPEDTDRVAAMSGPPAPDPTDQMALRDAVLDALRTLPEEQRAALVLVDMEGYSVDEAAQLLDCAPGTVKSRCARGRVKLVPHLSQMRDHGGGEQPEPREDREPNEGTAGRLQRNQGSEGHVEPARATHPPPGQGQPAPAEPAPHEPPGGDGR